MKLRPQKVNTDISDRLIQADMAREALNMRFMEVPDNNQFGLQTCAGNSLIKAHNLSGLTVCVGVCDLLDRSGIIYALWNENGNHGLWIYSDEYQQAFYQSSTLNLKQDMYPDEPDYVENYSVSIQEIDGLVYWQDEINFPKSVDWRKAIDGFYTSNMEADWEISRIKRKPAFGITGQYSTGNTPTDIRNSTDVSFPNTPLRGNQWAYSYVYYDNTESRLSPYSPVIWSEDVDFYLPQYESDNFLRLDADNANNTIKAVNFYFRVGNDGGWQLHKTVENDAANYVVYLGYKTLTINVPSQNTVSGTATLFDIGAQVAESVPITIRDTKLSQNRLFDANYVEGYDPWENLDFTITEQIGEPGYTTFHPECTYKIGVTLIDFWGRRIGVENVKEYKSTAQFDPGTLKTFVATYDAPTASFTDNDPDNGTRRLEVNFSGTLPDWCEYVELSITRNKTISSFFRTQSLLWQWAQVPAGNAFGTGWQTSLMERPTDPNKKGIYKGIAFELNSGEGFTFSSQNQTYVRIVGVSVFGDKSTDYLDQINDFLDLNDPQYAEPFPVYFKVVGQEGAKLLCETTEAQFNMFDQVLQTIGAPQPPIASSRWYIEVLTFATSIPDIYYGSTLFQYLASDVTSGPTYLTGDCYVKTQLRNFSGGLLTNMYGFNSTTGNLDRFNFTVGSFSTTMTSISQSLINPFSSFWDTELGAPNTEIADQAQVHKSNYIRWSGASIVGTQLNQLSNASALDEIAMPVELGFINGLMLVNSSQALNTVLLAWMSNGVQTNYLSQAQVVDTTGSALTLDTTRVIGTSRTLVGHYGTTFLKHLTPSKTGTGYAYSTQFLDIIRYAQDGLTPLGSTHGWYLAIRGFTDTRRCAIGFDPYYEEVVFSGADTNGLAFNDPGKSYQGRRSYENVDRFWTYQNLNLISFKDGNLYLHSYENNANLFYGEAKDSSLTVIANPEVGVLKTWNFMGIDGDLVGPVNFTTDQGQTTNLQLNEFIDRKGYWFAAIKNATNNGGDKYNGELVESKVITAEIDIDATTQKKINFVEISGTISQVQ